jgi:hypothetical protein
MAYEVPSKEKAVSVAGKTFTDQRTLGRELIKLYGIRSPGDLASCSTCHR